MVLIHETKYRVGRRKWGKINGNSYSKQIVQELAECFMKLSRVFDKESQTRKHCYVAFLFAR